MMANGNSNSNTKVSGNENNETKGPVTGSNTRDDNRNKRSVSTERGTAPEVEEETDDARAEREESEARSNGMTYANKIDDSEEDINGIDNDDDMRAAQWLIANGYAEMHTVQTGMDVTNYILLTEDGKRALQTSNE